MQRIIADNVKTHFQRIKLSQSKLILILRRTRTYWIFISYLCIKLTFIGSEKEKQHLTLSRIKGFDKRK
jgi:hypothetical protein